MLCHVYDKLLPLLFMSECGMVPDDLDYIFNYSRSESEREKTERGVAITNAVNSAMFSGVISQKIALKEVAMDMNRIAQLRKQQRMTQADLAEKLGVGVSTVAMWESGKRTPSFKLLNDLSDIFDKTIEFILGTSDDDRSPRLAEPEVERLGTWSMEDDCRKIMKDYLSLDSFGKAAVENLIQMEKLRCMNQQTIITKSEDK